LIRFWKLTGFLVPACVGWTQGLAQGLAPEVVSLASIKSHIREELSNLPNYTCLETITRFHKEPRGPKRFQGKMQPLDVARLEIVYSNHREWHGSPGGRNLSADNPYGFVGSGMIGTGAFAMGLNNLMEGATISYRGEEAIRGRTAVRYDFDLPRFLKAFVISVLGGSGTVGEEGSFWVDPHSLDFIRLESHANEIPPYLLVEEESEIVNYTRTRIGERNVLLAQQADLHLLDTSGEESYDRLEFTHCRAFLTESTVRFEPESHEPGKELPPDAPAVISAPLDPNPAVPALLLVTVQLSTPITNNDVVGTLIEGKVSGDVRHKGKIVIRDGSLIHGRIRRLERYQSTTRGLIVGLEFTDVETTGGPLRFYADLFRMDRHAGIRPALSEQVIVRSGGGIPNPLADYHAARVAWRCVILRGWRCVPDSQWFEYGLADTRCDSVEE
jgi:hypothetical protein